MSSFDVIPNFLMLRDISIRCTTSLCALPMINMGYLDRDWYEGIVQKLKWNVPIRPETDAADIAMFTSRSLLRSKGVQGHSPASQETSNSSNGDADGLTPAAVEQQHISNGGSEKMDEGVQNEDADIVQVGADRAKL